LTMQITRTRYSPKERSEITIPNLAQRDFELLSQIRAEGKIDFKETHTGTVIKTKQYVGTIGLSRCTLDIEPKINVRNLMYMLGEAKRLEPSFFSSTVGAESQPSLYNFVVHLFILMTEDLFRKGVWKSYETQEEPLQFIRGRILTKELATRSYGTPIPVWCRYDDYTGDVIENQVIRYVLEALDKTELPPELDRTRRKLLSILSEVSQLSELHSDRIDAINYNRLNSDYRPVHSIGRLILGGLSFGESTGAFRPYSFLFDMELLFQEFIYSVLRRELEDNTTKVRRQPPRTIPKLKGPTELQNMTVIPDMLVIRGGKKVVLDTKWKEPFREGRTPRTTALHPDNFHQMVSYMTLHNAPGILLYPQEGLEPVDAEFGIQQVPNSKLHVKTVNLNFPVEKVRSEIAGVADYIRGLL
jgi:5-methylcytosine-specific restriction enzyme subunit McrC